ncbi:hypothetical protein [Actinoplanes awajinensis]|uniref:hypothetical protein n=1 Tax=Actinoplanes awajinensis TaxID=135946 RepID=UPI000A4E335D|nr:hypothetical protein [Actinoplanes awajinensis]
MISKIGAGARGSVPGRQFAGRTGMTGRSGRRRHPGTATERITAGGGGTIEGVARVVPEILKANRKS